MALKIDEIMDLSLDDYIAISKKSTNNSLIKDNHEKIIVNNNSKDAKFGRRKGNIDDEEEDDDMLMLTAKEELEETPIEELNTEIWKGPDPSISYIDCNDQRNDLRQKLNNCNKNSQNVSAVQYRMMAPNNNANRPRGLPTLLPLDVHVKNWTHKANKRNGYSRGNRGNNFQRGFNNGGNFHNNNNKPGNGVNNGRVQRNRGPNSERNNYKNAINSSVNSPTRAQNMIIETPTSSINLVSSPPLNPSFQLPHQTIHDRRFNNSSQSLPIGNLTPQAEAVLNLNSNGVQKKCLSTGGNNESLKSVLGFQGNVSDEMMPLFASRLMEYIQSGLQSQVVHKPVYDMKIQKDIHEIQNKPLLYKCPGGEVVSSDGTGVNCKIIPRTSGVSLNCRFA